MGDISEGVADTLARQKNIHKKNYYVDRNIVIKIKNLCGVGRVHAQHGDCADRCAGGVRERGLLHHCL
jgi:hypothetical protein